MRNVVENSIIGLSRTVDPQGDVVELHAELFKTEGTITYANFVKLLRQRMS